MATKKAEAVELTPEESTQRIRVKIRAYDNKIIDQCTKLIIETVMRSGAQVRGPIPLPTEKKRYTVLRSTFKDKNARDQYEIRVHKRIVDIINTTAKTIDELSHLNLPAGVDVEIKM